MKHTKQIVSAALLVAAAGAIVTVAGLAGCDREQKGGGMGAVAAMERPPAAVFTAAALSRDVPVYLEQIGRTAAREMVTIRPQVGGRIVAIHFEDGANVKKGDPLFTIDPRPFQAALDEKKALLAQAQATLKLNASELERVQGLSGTGAISAQEIESKQNAVAVAEAQVQSAQAAVETATLNLDYCKITSPIDGRTGQRQVDVGNVVNGGGGDGGGSNNGGGPGGGGGGGNMLLTIQRLDPIYADFTVTENEFATVRRFMAQGALDGSDPTGRVKVLVELPADAGSVLAAMGGAGAAPATPADPSAAPAGPSATPQPGAGAAPLPAAPSTAPTGPAAGPATLPTPRSVAPREGVLTFLDNAVQQGTGTVRVRATLPNADRYFWPGQFVRVKLVLTVKKNAVLIPAQAQQIGQQGPFVYVIKDGAAQLRPIVMGQRQGDLIVVDGVEAGEQVVVQGQMGVMPGGKVMIANAPPAAPTTQTAGAN